MYPFISVIIPTYNRKKSLHQCLDALISCEYPRKKFEVIVVDDGGSISLEEVIEHYNAFFEVKLITQTNSGPAAARNTGATFAKGDFLAFTDDDCLPDKNWLRELAVQLMQTPNGLVGGHTINLLKNNCYATTSQLLIDYLYEYYQQNSLNFFTSNNIALASKVFKAVDGFDQDFPLAAAEDRDLCGRLSQYGCDLIYAPQAIVGHAHVLNFVGFFRQHFNYGRGAYFFHQKREQRQEGKRKNEPLKFYINLLFYPFKMKKHSRLQLMGLMCISQLANALGFYFQRWQVLLNR